MARRGGGRMVALIGPSGIGKTRLAAEVAAAVAGDGVVDWTYAVGRSEHANDRAPGWHRVCLVAAVVTDPFLPASGRDLSLVGAARPGVSCTPSRESRRTSDGVADQGEVLRGVQL
jgi:hypothetical protein